MFDGYVAWPGSSSFQVFSLFVELVEDVVEALQVQEDVDDPLSFLFALFYEVVEVFLGDHVAGYDLIVGDPSKEVLNLLCDWSVAVCDGF